MSEGSHTSDAKHATPVVERSDNINGECNRLSIRFGFHGYQSPCGRSPRPEIACSLEGVVSHGCDRGGAGDRTYNRENHTLGGNTLKREELVMVESVD